MIKMKNNSNPIDVNTYFKEVFTNAGIGIMTLDAKSSIENINEDKKEEDNSTSLINSVYA